MSVIWRVSKYGFRYPWRLGGAYVMNLATTLSALAIPPLIGNAIDRALGSGSQVEVLFAGLAILGAGVLRGVCGYMQIYLTGWMTGLVEKDLQVRLLDKLQHLSFGFHDRHRTGDLMSRATADVDAVGEFIHRGLIQTTRTALWFGVVAFIMLATNWQLALIAMAFLPLSTWVLGSLSIKADEAFTRSQVETGKMTAVLQESIVGMRLAKAFGAGDHERARFRSVSSEVTRSNYRAYKVEVSHSTFSTYLFVAAVGALLWFGAREVVFGRLTEGELAMFLLYMALLREPVRTTGWIVAVFAAARASGRRLFEILDAESPVPERPDARRVARTQGRVAFERVSFSYDSDSETLHNVEFEVQAGQTVALLGAPGSGKTSIVHPGPQVLRRNVRPGDGRWSGCKRPETHGPPPQHRHRAPGRLHLRGFVHRQHILRDRRGDLRGDQGGRKGRAASRFHRGPARQVRNLGRRAGREAVRGPAAAARDSAHRPAGPGHPTYSTTPRPASTWRRSTSCNRRSRR